MHTMDGVDAHCTYTHTLHINIQINTLEYENTLNFACRFDMLQHFSYLVSAWSLFLSFLSRAFFPIAMTMLLLLLLRFTLLNSLGSLLREKRYMNLNQFLKDTREERVRVARTKKNTVEKSTLARLLALCLIAVRSNLMACCMYEGQC